MFTTATITCYDVLDAVWIQVRLVQRPSAELDAIPGPLTLGVEVPGVGENDPYEWLRDALVGLLEAI